MIHKSWDLPLVCLRPSSITPAICRSLAVLKTEPVLTESVAVTLLWQTTDMIANKHSRR